MSSVDIHDSARELLRTAGWFPGRVVDIASCSEAWNGRGIAVNHVAVNFCREFSGLKLEHPPRINIRGREHTDFTALDPVAAVDGISDRVLEEYSRIAGEPLCPVGTNRSHMTVLIGPSGRVLGGVDNYLFEIGAGPVDAINKICAGAVPEKIGEWMLEL